MKIVIKNCPALSYGKGLRFKKCYRTNWKEYCKDCSDCVIKQIVELCNDVLEQETDPINTLEMSFVQKILNLLEIEEVNEE